DRGLGAALSTLAEASATPVTLSVSIAERPSPAIESIAYFCAAELLANVTKHSGASRATVTAGDQGGRLLMTVTDDGAGGGGPGPGRRARGAGRAGADRRRAARHRQPARRPDHHHDRTAEPRMRPSPLRIVIAEDAAIMRDGLTRPLPAGAMTWSPRSPTR